jgi:hypothetical protein
MPLQGFLDHPKDYLARRLFIDTSVFFNEGIYGWVVVI